MTCLQQPRLLGFSALMLMNGCSIHRVDLPVLWLQEPWAEALLYSPPHRPPSCGSQASQGTRKLKQMLRGDENFQIKTGPHLQPPHHTSCDRWLRVRLGDVKGTEIKGRLTPTCLWPWADHSPLWASIQRLTAMTARNFST